MQLASSQQAIDAAVNAFQSVKDDRRHPYDTLCAAALPFASISFKCSFMFKEKYWRLWQTHIAIQKLNDG